MNATTLAMEGAALRHGQGAAAPLPPAGDASAPMIGASGTSIRTPQRALPAEIGHALDTAGALVALLLVWVALDLSRLSANAAALLTHEVSVRQALLVGGLVLVWPRLLGLAGLYGAAFPRLRDEAARAAAAGAVGAGIAFAFPLAALAPAERLNGTLLFWAAATALTLAVRAPLRRVPLAAGARLPRRVLIVGSGPRAWRLRQEVEAHTTEGLELLGFVDTDDHSLAERMGLPKLGSLDDLERILMHQVVDEVLIALPIKSCYTQIHQSLEVCARVGVESKYLADAFRCSLAQPRVEHGSSHTFMTMKVFPDDVRVLVKRLLDFLGALAGLLVLSPLLIGIAVAIKATSSGPVIFTQERYGQNKRRFRMFKFRTMVPDAEARMKELEARNEAAGPIFKMRHDPRVTPIGAWLRRTSLDELPQLANVLLGQMSLVGPRPMAVRDVQLFEEAWFMRRFSAPPGMTGLWQVSGRSNLGFDDWVTLDLKYIDEWSLALDLKILAKTLPTVLRGVGAV